MQWPTVAFPKWLSSWDVARSLRAGRSGPVGRCSEVAVRAHDNAQGAGSGGRLPLSEFHANRPLGTRDDLARQVPNPKMRLNHQRLARRNGGHVGSTRRQDEIEVRLSCDVLTAPVCSQHEPATCRRAQAMELVFAERALRGAADHDRRRGDESTPSTCGVQFLVLFPANPPAAPPRRRRRRPIPAFASDKRCGAIRMDNARVPAEPARRVLSPIQANSQAGHDRGAVDEGLHVFNVSAVLRPR